MKVILSKKAVLLFAFMLMAAGLSAQAINDIRVNEVLVKNVDSYEDDYGHRVGWIELFNAGYSQVDIGGAYLKVDGKEYRIPKNDTRTVIAPQGYVVFFAEGTASKGTFHTNFTLDETGYIEFYDQSGKGAPISKVEYNYDEMQDDMSIGWYEDHDGELKFGQLDATTPYATNETIERIPRDEHFRQADPYGIVMTFTAVLVVFTALILLYIVFKLLGRSFARRANRKENKSDQQTYKSAAEIAAKKESGELGGEELAAIALALYKYSEELHDIENTVLTINRVARVYSPWSSKIYGLRVPVIPTKK